MTANVHRPVAGPNVRPFGYWTCRDPLFDHDHALGSGDPRCADCGASLDRDTTCKGLTPTECRAATAGVPVSVEVTPRGQRMIERQFHERNAELSQTDPEGALAELDARYHDHLPEGANCPLCGVEHAAINPSNLRS